MSNRQHGMQPLYDKNTGKINKAALEFLLGAPSANIDKVLSFVRDALEADLKVIKTAMEDLNTMQDIAHYQPADDEPSIFGITAGQPSTEWVMWRSNKGKTSILRAYEDGVKVIENLVKELPRKPGELEDEPALSFYHPEFAKAGIKRPVLSFRWVIFAKYRRSLDWYETQADGERMMASEYGSMNNG